MKLLFDQYGMWGLGPEPGIFSGKDSKNIIIPTSDRIPTSDPKGSRCVKNVASPYLAKWFVDDGPDDVIVLHFVLLLFLYLKKP